MLVLSRKDGQSVIVGGTGAFPRLCKVTVLGITGNKVRLGFEVDASVPVNREEVLLRICAEESVEVGAKAAAESSAALPRQEIDAPIEGNQ